MKTTHHFSIISLLVLTALLAAACAPAAAPAAATQPPGAPAGVAQGTPPVAAPIHPTATDGPRLIPVADARVQVGQGSPIPVEVQVAGQWPDLCAQLASVEQRTQGSRIEFTLLAAPAQAACPPDHLGLPFAIALPLNMQEMPAGGYTVAVNGFETAFEWTGASSGAAAQPAAETAPIAVHDVRVEVGVGSPIPVMVLVSGTWPGLCSQLARIEQRITGATIEIDLQANANPPSCPPDAAGLPFRIALPLNMTQLPLGPYTVRANGMQAAFDWQAQPGAAEAPAAAFPIAYTGSDGNLWLLEANLPEPRKLTQDAYSGGPAGPSGTSTPVVQYYFPALSSDGRFLAYRRDEGRPVESGLNFTFGLWVMDLISGETHRLLDRASAGFAWKPGSHLLAYAPGAEDGYFTTRGQVDTAKARGILTVDLDQPGAAPIELVRPERGYSLALPVWSPDGRFIAFDEVTLYEGRGLFAYYDVQAARYTPLDTQLGQFAWTPNGDQIAYDLLTYSPNGEERIYLRPRQDGPGWQLSPAEMPGYTHTPRISPQGDRIAYWLVRGEPGSARAALMLQPLSGGAAQELGIFENAFGLGWAPDGRALVFSAGPLEAQQIILVSAADGAQTVLASGKEPALPAP